MAVHRNLCLLLRCFSKVYTCTLHRIYRLCRISISIVTFVSLVIALYVKLAVDVLRFFVYFLHVWYLIFAVGVVSKTPLFFVVVKFRNYSAWFIANTILHTTKIKMLCFNKHIWHKQAHKR